MGRGRGSRRRGWKRKIESLRGRTKNGEAAGEREEEGESEGEGEGVENGAVKGDMMQSGI